MAHRIPYPPNKGDKIRSFHLLQHLAKRYRVHLGTFVDDPADWSYVEPVRAMCSETCFVRLHPVQAKLASLRGFVTGEALTLPYYRSRRLQRWVDDILGRDTVRHIVVFSSAMAQFIRPEARVGRCALLDFVDVDSDKWRQYSRRRIWPMRWLYRREGRALLRFERAMAAVFDASVFVTEAEAALFKRLAPASAQRVSFFNNGVDTAFFSPDRHYANPYGAGEQGLVFTGAMDYWANVDAVVWFAEKVFPRVRVQAPEARFYIVGVRPAPEVRKLAEIQGVVVTGAVVDVRPYLAHARAAVIPLRIARGVQNKVLEAMAMGKVVLASAPAKDGISALPGRDLLMAEGVDGFVEMCIRVLRGEYHEAELGQSARQCVLHAYNWTHNLKPIDDLLKARNLHQALSGPDASTPVGSERESIFF